MSKWPLVAATVVVLLVAGGGAWFGFVQPRAALELPSQSPVAINSAVTVRVRGWVDTSKLTVRLTPRTATRLTAGRDTLVVHPNPRWAAAQTYGIEVIGTGIDLKGTFRTQPTVSVSAVLLNGRPIKSGALVPLGTRSLSVLFTETMKRPTVHATIDAKPIADAGILWTADSGSLALPLPALVPYQSVALALAVGASSSQGFVLDQPFAFSVQPMAVEPTAPATELASGGRPLAPVEIVMDNSGPAHPQSGLQSADIVYEYLAEHSISRFTLLYFGLPTSPVGPVRSCRMINPYLGFAFRGVTMCSGASDGTLNQIIGGAGGPRLPSKIEDYDGDGSPFFFRNGSKGAPFDLFTDAQRAQRLRDQLQVTDQTYTLDPDHPDATPAPRSADPTIALHGATYKYDVGTRQYLRFDQGKPLMDAATHAQVHVKTVAVVHTDFHDAGWLEDATGHSVWYDLLGSGPAEIYSDGGVIDGQWHMGDRTQPYYNNGQAMWFSDSTGVAIELNSGLTWIHIAGNGQ